MRSNAGHTWSLMIQKKKRAKKASTQRRQIKLNKRTNLRLSKKEKQQAIRVL